MFRVYKKSKDFYRVEARNARGGWTEMLTSHNLTNLLLYGCRFVVDEAGRRATVEGSFASSADVPVHAWIECDGVAFTGPFRPDGILYYNPFTVSLFQDRAAHEARNPRTLAGAQQVRIAGNLLEYAGGQA